MILVLRLLPFLTGLAVAGLFAWQRVHPTVYPWAVIVAVTLVIGVSLILAWRRGSLRDLSEKMAPTIVVVLALGFGLLLSEGRLANMMVVILAGVCSFTALELLFLYVFHPASYPVNGLSRLNIAFVPLAAWYTASTSVGLLTFLHTPRVWHVVLLTIMGAVLFRTTGHPGASPAQNRVWMLIGAATGLHVGWVSITLPLSMPIHGALAAIVFASVLRVRRYLYDPRPSRRVAWGESVAACILLISVLATAQWL
jgi:hypothetical protein